jgi:hypothetical protein
VIVIVGHLSRALITGTSRCVRRHAANAVRAPRLVGAGESGGWVLRARHPPHLAASPVASALVTVGGLPW